MTKVNINGHSHQVEIEHDGELAQVVRAARKLWRETLQPPPSGSAGPAFGFVAEKRASRDLYPMDADGK